MFDAEKKSYLANATQHYFVLTARRKQEAAGRPVQQYAPVNGPIFVPTPARAAEVLEGDTAEPGKPSCTSLLYWEDLAQICDRSEVRLKLCVSSARNLRKAGYFLPGA